MDKVPASARFLDLSDYTRPLAMAIARALVPTRISPLHVSAGFIFAGTAAGVLLALDRHLPVAAALLILKAVLDGVDGSLARLRSRPSRVGRFLDSVGDAWVNVAVYGGIGWLWCREAGSLVPLVVAGLAMIASMLQVSAYNYWFVLYRHATGGDLTSRTVEDADGGYTWDDTRWLGLLARIYALIYGWQDRLIAALDRRVASGAGAPGPTFLTAASAVGLGTQMGILALAATLGQPRAGVWLILTLFTIYTVGLFVLRGVTAPPKATTAEPR